MRPSFRAVVLSYLKYGVQSKLSVNIWWTIIWTACEMPWREIQRFVYASVGEVFFLFP